MTTEPTTTTTTTDDALAATEPPQDAQEAAETPQGPQESGDEPQGDDEGGKAAREARKYRQRLRAAEADLEAANARVDHLQRTEIERMAMASGLPKPAALWAGGTSLDQLRDEHGNISPTRVNAEVQRVKDEFGIGGRQPDPAQQALPSPAEGDQWAEAFRM